MNLKFFYLFLFFPVTIFSQNYLQKICHDSDLVYLNCTSVKELGIFKVNFIEEIDSLGFKDLPPLPSNVKYIIHKVHYNESGLPIHYEWSFNENNSIETNETETKYRRYYIINEYDITYHDSNSFTINISDASLDIAKIFTFSSDSINIESTTYTLEKSIKKSKAVFSKHENNIIYKKTGSIRSYLPYMQIIQLGVIQSNAFYINDLPANAFMSGKFENNRFLLEIRPGLFIFFEISA